MKHKIKLAAVCQQVRGVSYTPKDEKEVPIEGYIPILRANNIQEKLEFNDLIYVRSSKINNKQLLGVGDILVCASSGSKHLVGKAAIFFSSPFSKISFGAFCKVVRPQNIYAPYLFHFFNSAYYRHTISEIAQGANINNIRNEHLNNLDIYVPSELEQKRIAGILDKVQSLIALQKQQLEKLDLLIKSKFIDMFGDPSCLESVTVPLKTYAQISGGYAFPSDKFLSAGIPIIRISNLQNGSVVSSSKCCFSPQFLSSHSEYAVQYEDILLAMSGATVGKTAIYKQKNPALLNQRIACLRNIDKVSCTAFLYIITKMKWFYDSILNLSAGCAQPNISISQIQGLLVPKASFVRQRQFSCFYYNIEKQKVLLKNRLASLETLYKSLMQEYFG